MQYSTSQFLQTANKVFVAEVSELNTPNVMGRLASGARGIVLVSPDGTKSEFVFSHVDTDASGEDVQGWNFKPTIQCVEQTPNFAGVRVLIIND